MASPNEFYSVSPASIVLFGDSITQYSFSVGGFGARLADYYQRRADVINRGLSGYNTEWAVAALKHVLPRNMTEPALVTVFFGANDASDAKLNARQHVPLKTYKEKLKEIVDYLRSNFKSTRILFITPPPIDEPGRLKYQKSRYGQKASGVLERSVKLASEYASACESLGDELKIPVVNLCKMMLKEKDYGYLNDGLHLSPEGNKFVFESIKEAIQNHYHDIAVYPCKDTGATGSSGSTCPHLIKYLPWHDEIDPSVAEMTIQKVMTRVKSST
ncbi:hypothetical protein AAMO2058_000854000 [Amorphochlora amoebiformis]